MASKAKTYGKKTTRNLAAEFAKLGVSSAHGKIYQLYLIYQRTSAHYVADQDRVPLLERSENVRTHRIEDQLTAFGQSQLLGQRLTLPPGVLPQGGAPGGESSDDVSFVAESAGAVPAGYSPLDNPAFDILPGSILARPTIEQPIRPAGPVLRSRRGRGVVPTVAATLSAEDLDYLTPLTSIDDVLSTVERIENWHDEWTRNCTVTKIAEGSFGSILRLQNKTDPSQFTIGKLMPLRPGKGPGSRTTSFTRIQDAANEAEMLITMSNYPGFAEFRRAEVLHGQLPPSLELEYIIFEVAHGSESGTTAKFVDHQLWLFLEMSYAGVDLEELFEKSVTKDPLCIRDTWDIFWAVTLALARGEEHFKFEHRDLQVQNICIKKNGEYLETQDGDDRMGIKRYTNTEVTIIDYTLSRATLEDLRTIFNPMHDERIFDGQGNEPDETLQYDTYRFMRQLVERFSLALTKKHRKIVRWDTFVPATNVLWLYYLLKILLRHTVKDVEPDDRAAKEDAEIWSKLKQLIENLGPGYPNKGGYHSAMDLVKPASHGSSESSSLNQSAEDEDDEKELDSEDEEAKGRDSLR
jgi:hypothetical protein